MKNGSGLILAGWILDGTGAPPRENAVVHVQDGKILKVSNGPAPKTPGLGVWDCSSCTVIPGLVDSHVHLAMSGTLDMAVRERQLFVPYEEALPVMKAHCRDHLARGVIAVRDGGDWGGHALRLARGREENLLALKCAGKAWRARGRYGKLVGRAPDPGKTLAQAISVDDQNPDFIKIVQSGLNSLLTFGKQTPPQFDAEELSRAVKAAAAQGLDVMAHANGEAPVKAAVEAGCASIEHGFFMGEDNLKRMADQGVAWVPTAVTMESYAASLPSGDPKAAGALRNLEHQLEQMAQARELGVHMACGTDAGSTGVNHGEALRREMALFVKAGFSVEEAVRAASSAGARLLGLESLGALAPGMDAHAAAFSGSPGSLLENPANPAGVMIRGEMQ